MCKYFPTQNLIHSMLEFVMSHHKNQSIKIKVYRKKREESEKKREY